MAFSERKYRSLSVKAQAKKVADLSLKLLKSLQQNTDYKGSETKQELTASIQKLLSWYAGPLDNLNPIAAPFMMLHIPGIEWQSHEFVGKVYDLYLLMRQHADLGPEQEVRLLVQNIARETAFIEHYKDQASTIHEPLPFRVAMYNLRSAHNAGAILRLTDCMGLRGAILAGYTPDAGVPGFRAASMGCEDWMSMLRIPASAQALRDALPAQGRLIALELTKQSTPLTQYVWPREGGIILLGNEELGLPAPILEACHDCIAIPMYGRKASLNVATACSMALYDLRTKYEKL